MIDIQFHNILMKRQKKALKRQSKISRLCYDSFTRAPFSLLFIAWKYGIKASEIGMTNPPFLISWWWYAQYSQRTIYI